jgi:uncharacterized damage-inducible protein DinB
MNARDDGRMPLPDDIDHDADELATLTWFLDYYRAVFGRKAEGLTDEQTRTVACPPSEMTVMGLVRHMADVERGWFRRVLVADEAGPIHYGDAHPTGDPDGDFHPGPDDTIAQALETWHAEVSVARANLAGRTPGDRADRASRDDITPNVRWILVHMIEEYARHCGHLDLLREAIDGVTGD